MSFESSSLLELDMGEADHDIFIFPVNILTGNKWIWKIAWKLWLSLTSISSQQFIQFALLPLLQNLNEFHTFSSFPNDGIWTNIYWDQHNFLLNFSVCVCVFVVRPSSFPSIEDRTGALLSSECKIDQANFADWMHFLSRKLESNLEALSVIT